VSRHGRRLRDTDVVLDLSDVVEAVERSVRGIPFRPAFVRFVLVALVVFFFFFVVLEVVVLLLVLREIGCDKGLVGFDKTS
jgi:hypothetical protein